jgi:hypothetical protein
MSAENPAEPQNKKHTSLKAFLDDYQRSIAVLGVFVALGIVWKTVQGKDSIPYVSYLCFLITIPILLEARKGYDYSKASWNLVIFIHIFQGILFLIALSLVVDYPDHLEKIIVGVIWMGIVLPLVTLIERVTNKMRASDYNDKVAFAESLDKNMPISDRNEIMVSVNAGLRKLYRIVWVFEGVLILLALFFSLMFVGYISEYIHATFDLILDRQIQIEAPKIEDPFDKLKLSG